MFKSKNTTIVPIPKIPIIKQSKRVVLFCNARDEENIVEWAAHHLNIGFDCIFIFDHKSKIPINTLFNSKRVVVIRYNEDGGIKIPLMKRALTISKKLNVDWMIYLDCDEFLYLNSYKNVKHLLQTYNIADALSINWLFFGSNFHKETPKGLNPDFPNLIIENYTKSDLILDQHVKTFVRPYATIQPQSPHHYLMKSNLLFCLPKRNMQPNSPFNPVNISYTNVGSYIAHYIYQSEETYKKRKCLLPGDDTGIFRKIDTNIHSQFNGYENTTMKDKYAISVREVMKKISSK